MSGIVLATGDLAMDRDNYDECFAGTAAVLREADIVFGQLETSFAERGVRLPQARHAVLARPDGAAALGRAGFDVISMAGNHVLDCISAAAADADDLDDRTVFRGFVDDFKHGAFLSPVWISGIEDRHSRGHWCQPMHPRRTIPVGWPACCSV